MKLKIVKGFAYAHFGYARREYQEGEVVEVTDKDDPEFVEVSIREGWAQDADKTGGEEKGKKGAPENKAKGGG